MNENDGKKMLREMRQLVRLRNKPVEELQPFQIGMNLFVSEEFEKAIDAFHRAIKLKPEFAFSHYYLGRCLRRIGKYDEAINSFERGVELNPLHAPSYSYLGDILLLQNQFIEAEKFFRQAINLQFDNLIALNGLARIIKNNDGNRNELSELLKDAYFRGANNPIILMELLSFQNFEADFYLQIAEKLQTQKSYHRAVFFFSIALSENTDNKLIQEKIDENLKHLNFGQD